MNEVIVFQENLLSIKVIIYEKTSPCINEDPIQGQLLEGVECHIYLYCFTFDDNNLIRAFVIIVLFPKKYSNKKVCANDIRKKNALGIY